MTHELQGSGDVGDYIAYLLRLWRETGGGSTQWRASLEEPQVGEKVGFASLEELFCYLRRETGDTPEKKGGNPRNEEKGT